MGAILAIIPARGGSKGVPGKNLRPVGGIPLVCHALRAAIGARRLTACLVSTDDERIAQVCRDAGGWVPFLRPADLASDSAPTWAALQHAVLWYEAETKTAVDAVVTLQPTTPLREAGDVDQAIETYLAAQPDVDSLISVCDAAEHHPLTLYYGEEGVRLRTFVEGANPNTRRQEFPPVYWRNGAIYVTRRDLLFQENRVVSDRPAAYVMPRERSVNIDAPFDLELADFLWQRSVS